jgi:hypothetical protein
VPERSIGIFTAKDGAGGEPVSFFGCDDISLLASLYQHATEIAGPGMTKFNPGAGMEVSRVGEVVVQQVDDECVYKVNTAVGKPEVNRKPDGEPGTWAVQSLIFSKETFSVDDAKAWIADHSDKFGNYGVDETDTSFRFRQFDDQHFDEFRTVSLAEGVAAAWGKIATGEQDEEASKAAFEKSMVAYLAIRKVNDSIMKAGVKILCGTALSTVSKADDGTETEERFVLSMVLEPTDGEDGAPFKPDTQDDVYSKPEVRAACHVWMEYHGAVDLMHNWKALGKQDVRVLECYVAPVEFKNGDDTVAEGSWMLALRIANDELWEAIKSGDLGAFSIGGTANRVPLEVA